MYERDTRLSNEIYDKIKLVKRAAWFDTKS